MKKIIVAFCILIVIYSNVCISQNFIWAHCSKNLYNHPNANLTEGYQVATDAMGNVYLTGNFFGSVVFGTNTLTSVGGSINPDVYLVKYNAAGNVLWAKSFGDSLGELSYSVKTDISGNVYVTGYFQSHSITIGTHTLTNMGYSNVFLVKYDTNGNPVWATCPMGAITGSKNEAYNVVTDSLKNVYITGYFTSSSLNFGIHTLTASANGDFFVVKYDSTGTVMWAKNSDGTSGAEGWGIAADVLGNIYVTGYFGPTAITLGTQTYACKGGVDVFLIKYNANGNLVWAKTMGSSNLEQGRYVALDASNKNIYITGKFQSPTLSFGTHTINNSVNDSTSTDAYLAKYDTSGIAIWANSIGGNDNDEGYCIATNNLNELYITGGFLSQSIAVGNYTISSSQYHPNMFIINYDGAGNASSADALTDGGEVQNGIAIDNFCNLYIGGYYSTSDFVIGQDSLPLTSIEDAFVAKFTCTNNSGIKQNVQRQQNIKLYPNPAHNNFTVEVNGTDKQQLQLFDISGKQVLQQTINTTTTIDVSQLQNGVYFIQLKNNTGSSTQKLIVQH